MIMKAIYITHMTCPRCISLISSLIEKTGTEIISIELGQARLAKLPSPEKLALIKQNLEAYGFELVDPTKSLSVDLIKKTIAQIIQDSKTNGLNVDWTSLLSKKLNQDYYVINAYFNYMEGITMDQFIARQKIERVKELLFKNNNLSDIAQRLGYHSVQQLCNHFKKMTGFSPSSFKMSSQNLIHSEHISYSN
jgi:AraC family transcriptional regulator